jgi:hypothetical protein
MSFYFRKSKTLTKNSKLNFSKSGVGISGGIKGARIGVNSKGQIYTHIGRNGIYYKKNLGDILHFFKLLIKLFK